LWQSAVHPRVSNETPNIDALTIVAASVRFNTLAIFVTPFLSFAIVFNVRTSVAVHRITFLGPLAIPEFFIGDLRIPIDALEGEALASITGGSFDALTR
jgi:hypothetical protein